MVLKKNLVASHAYRKIAYDSGVEDAIYAVDTNLAMITDEQKMRGEELANYMKEEKLFRVNEVLSYCENNQPGNCSFP